jgi:hypothetical protein
MAIAVLRDCAYGTFAHIGPFDDELLTGRFDEAIARLESLTGLEAAQLLLATCRRNDSVIDMHEIDDLAEAMGVFEDNTRRHNRA